MKKKYTTKGKIGLSYWVYTIVSEVIFICSGAWLFNVGLQYKDPISITLSIILMVIPVAFCIVLCGLQKEDVVYNFEKEEERKEENK